MESAPPAAPVQAVPPGYVAVLGGLGMFLGGLILVPISYLNLMAYPLPEPGREKADWVMFTFIACGMVTWLWLLLSAYGLVHFRRSGRNGFLAFGFFLGLLNIAGIINVLRSFDTWGGMDGRERIMVSISLGGAGLCLLFAAATCWYLTRPSCLRFFRS